MDFIFITGKLGQGKTLVAMSKIKERIERGCKVATNCDVNLHNMFTRSTDKPRVLRIPDKPSLDDLEAIGTGYDMSSGYDESKNGLLVLDECGTWFNARNWQDKSRAGVNSWFLHARKLGWDVYLIVQDMSIIDSQARESLSAGIARCKRLDKVAIPFFTSFVKTFSGIDIRPPRCHAARVEDADGLLLDRWLYRGTDLFSAYDTRQAFRSDYPHGVYSLLTPWHIYGRHSKPLDFHRRMRITRIYAKRFSRLTACIAGAVLAASAVWFLKPSNPATPSTPVASVSPETEKKPATWAETFQTWSYDGSMVVNNSATFFVVSSDGVRTSNNDDLFDGVTFSEVSPCVLKLRKASEHVYLKCKHSEPSIRRSDSQESVAIN